MFPHTFRESTNINVFLSEKETFSPPLNRTPVFRVTCGHISRYTTENKWYTTILSLVADYPLVMSPLFTDI
jgi:hypothetical protein